MFHYIKEYSPTLYNALLYWSDIDCVIFRHINYDKDENIDWKKAVNKHAWSDSLLDKDVIRALKVGASKCKPEYKLMVRCAEAELENEGGYWK